MFEPVTEDTEPNLYYLIEPKVKCGDLIQILSTTGTQGWKRSELTELVYAL